MRAALLLFSFLFIAAISHAQVQKRVMVEQFTQASCAPCAEQNPGFNQILFNNAEQVVALKYQTSFPGFDPMNEHNPDEVLIRRQYYGVTGVPNVYLNGEDAGLSSDVTAAQVNNAYQETTPLEMELSHSLTEDLDSISITCLIRNVAEDSFDVADAVLHVAIVEEALEFPIPPGSTDEQDFYSVMRKMLPNVGGTELGLIPGGDSAVVTIDAPLPDYIYDYSQIGAVAFVQDDASKEMFQATLSESLGKPEGFLDLSLNLNFEEPGTYCQDTLAVTAEVENLESTPVTTFDATLLADGSPVETITIEDSLGQNDVLAIEFNTMLVTGDNEVAVELSNVNNARDLNTLNEYDNTITLRTLPIEPFAVDFEDGFESLDVFEIPENTVIETPSPLFMGVVNEGFLDFWINDPAPGIVGAYGQSENAVMVDFFQWNDPGAQSNLIYGKVDLTERENAIITFDYTFAQFDGFATDDRFIVSVSENCGETWTTVYNEGGSEFATVPAQGPFYYPAADDWATDTIDISAYDGTPELSVRFTAQTDYGNNLFFDNIAVSSEMPNSTDEAGQLKGQVFAYPNPATELVYVDFSLMQKSEVLAQVFDMSGRQVATLLPGAELGTGGHQLRWAPKEAGIYLIRIATEDSAVTKRVTVVK